MFMGRKCLRKRNNIDSLCYFHSSVGSVGTSQQFATYFKAINDPESRFVQADDDVLLFNERYVNGELQIMFQELDIEISLSEIKKVFLIKFLI